MENLKFIKFNSANEMADYIKKNIRPNGHCHYTGRPDFCADSMETALEHLSGERKFTAPTLELAEKFGDTLKALDDGKNMNIPDVVYDMTGGECDIQRYLSGEPENMRDFEPSTAKRLLNVLVIPNVYYGISQESIVSRGAAFVALINHLQNTNKFILSVNVMISLEYHGTMYAWLINFDMSKIFSRQALAYLVTAPSVTRRIMFALLEIAENDDNCGGYGCYQLFDSMLNAFQNSTYKERINELFGEAEGRITFDTLQDDTTDKQEIDKLSDIVKKYAEKA